MIHDIIYTKIDDVPEGFIQAINNNQGTIEAKKVSFSGGFELDAVTINVNMSDSDYFNLCSSYNLENYSDRCSLLKIYKNWFNYF